MDSLQKAELIISALQQRIGEMSVSYETQIAILRAELTMFSNDQQDKQNAKEEYSNSLLNITQQ